MTTAEAAEKIERKRRRRGRRRRIGLTLGFLLCAYVSSYLVFSRAGVLWSKMQHTDRQYLVPGAPGWVKSFVGVMFLPLNQMEVLAGTGPEMDQQMWEPYGIGHRKH